MFELLKINNSSIVAPTIVQKSEQQQAEGDQHQGAEGRQDERRDDVFEVEHGEKGSTGEAPHCR